VAVDLRGSRAGRSLFVRVKRMGKTRICSSLSPKAMRPTLLNFDASRQPLSGRAEGMVFRAFVGGASRGWVPFFAASRYVNIVNITVLGAGLDCARQILFLRCGGPSNVSFFQSGDRSWMNISGCRTREPLTLCRRRWWGTYAVPGVCLSCATLTRNFSVALLVI